MLQQFRNWTVAILAGMLLALMIEYNSQLAKNVGSIASSWVAHGVGTVVSFLLIFVMSLLLRKYAVSFTDKPSKPFWIYLGGLPGAFTVVLASIALNGSLALSGVISLMLLGQIILSIALDHYGLLLFPKRPMTKNDIIAVMLLIIGSSMIIFGGK